MLTKLLKLLNFDKMSLPNKRVRERAQGSIDQRTIEKSQKLANR